MQGPSRFPSSPPEPSELGPPYQGAKRKGEQSEGDLSGRRVKKEKKDIVDQVAWQRKEKTVSLFHNRRHCSWRCYSHNSKTSRPSQLSHLWQYSPTASWQQRKRNLLDA